MLYDKSNKPNRISIGCFLKRFSINEEKNARKNEEMKISYNYNNKCLSLLKNVFQIMIFWANMAFWISDFDDFDNNKIS